MYKASQRSLETLLTELGIVNAEQLANFSHKYQGSTKHLTTLLIQENIIYENVYLKTLSEYLNIPWIVLADLNIAFETVKVLSHDILNKYQILPIKVDLYSIHLAMANPMDIPALEEVRLITGKEVEIHIASPLEIDTEINRCFDIQESMNKTIDLLARESESDQIAYSHSKQIVEDAEDAPIIKIVNAVIVDALDKRASDIHFEPKEDTLKIKYRIDGSLRFISTFPKDKQEVIISRLKIMADMDITNKRIPQDGRSNFTYNNKWVDIRISALPTIYGEKVVMRLLPRDRVIFTMEQLGFESDCLITYQKLISSVSGMILVTGPTGCGKTTTLYSTLNWINESDQNIVTIEDPIEYRLTDVNQVEINEKAGLTFATGLRSILRQDPDIIMVGEIRDVETAQMAIRSALTGHSVFSTLHTSNCVGAISRLLDMGIPWYLLNAAVEVVLSQRLIRLLCGHCKVQYTPLPHELEIVKVHLPDDQGSWDILHKPVGCKICHNTGYFGRRAVFELLIPNEVFMKNLVNKGANLPMHDIVDYFSLAESALELARTGETSIEEVSKIIINSNIRK